MKEITSINRNRDRDITARQPLLDNPSETNNNINSNTNNNNHHHINSSTTSGISNSVAITLAGTMSSSRHSGTKYSKLENSMDSPSHKFINESVTVQQRMLHGQDEQLGVISDSIGTLKTVSRQIGTELDEQAV